MTPNRQDSFFDDLLYFNSLVLWDCIPEQESFQLYQSAWKQFGMFSPDQFEAEELRLAGQMEDVLDRVNALDMVLPLLETVSSRSIGEKPLATVKGPVPAIEGLRMQFEPKKNVTSVHLCVPPGVTDGKAFAAAVNRNKEGLQRFRRHQFALYYRLDMRVRALKLARICRETLPGIPDFKHVARFDRRVSDEGGRPRNWYSEVTRIGHAVTYFSSNRQEKSIGKLQDYIAEMNREPVQRHMLGEDLKRTCRRWGVSLWTGMGVDSYKSAVNSVWSQMRGSGDPLILRAVDRFKTEQKEQRGSRS